MPAYSNQKKIGLKKALGARPSFLRWGVPDARRVTDGAIAGNVVTSASGQFLAKHVGRTIVIPGAGVGGSLLITTIAGFSSATQVTVSTAAAVSVSGVVIVWGTDNADAFAAAVSSVESGGNALYVDGGLYLTTRTITLRGNLRVYGPCMRIDIPHTQQINGRYACILTTANPGIEIEPYAGVQFENIHISCLGTNDSIDLWDVEGYEYQVGIWLGNITKPLLTTPADDYAVGGSGGAVLRGLSVSTASGWGFYCYKFWGQSRFEHVQVYGCGTVPSGGVPRHHGGIALAGECADLIFDGIHIIGVEAGYSGPLKIGVGIKCGGNGAELDAIDRFKIGPTHSKFQNITIEGKGHYPVVDYVSFASSWSQCFFGGAWDQIEIGESPTVSWLNNESVWTGCGSFGLQHLYVRSRRVQIQGWMAEGVTKLNVHYNYPVLSVTGKNLKLVPETDTGAQSGYPNRIWESMPIAKSDQQAFPYSLVPDFQSSRWTITGSSPASFLVNGNLLRLAQGGTAAIDITGLTPNVVYTCAFRHRVAFDAALEGSTYRIYATGGADIISLQVGSSDTALAGTVTWILFQFLAPSSGNITFECANSDFNQTEWTPPFIGFGPLTEVYTAGYLIQADTSSSTIGGSAIHASSDQQVWGDILARKSDSMTAALLGRAPANISGVGLNNRWNGAEWTREGNGSYNGGGLLLAKNNDGQILLIPVPSTGLNQDTHTDSEILEMVRLAVRSSGAEVFGPVGTESSLTLKKPGAASSGNVEYRLTHRPNNADFILYAYDGTDFWNILEAYKATNQVLVNGIDVANLLPAGVAGQFLRSNGGTSRQFAKVDVGSPTNIQFTGSVAGRPVKATSGGALETGPITLENNAHVSTAITDNWFLVASGGAVSAFSPTGAAGVILSAPGVIGTISGLAGFDLTTLNTVFASIASQIDDLYTELANKSDVGHTHSMSDVSSLSAALDGKAASGHTHAEYAGVDHTHD